MPLDPNSGFEIRFTEHEGYLHALVRGEADSLEISLAYWQRVVDECGHRKVRRLLLEEEFPNEISTVDVYELMNKVAAMVKMPLRIAFVDRDLAQEGLNRFGETVALNRGLQGRLFTNLKDAEAYLRSD